MKKVFFTSLRADYQLLIGAIKRVKTAKISLQKQKTINTQSRKRLRLILSICKQVLIIYAYWLVSLGIFSSCSNELADDSTLKNTPNRNILKNSTNFSYSSSCRCLPFISAYYENLFNEVVFAWSGNSQDFNDHNITLKGYINNSAFSKRVLQPTGSLRIPVYTSNFKAKWSINCANSNCSSCKKDGSIFRNETGVISSGSFTECYKEYKNYRVDGGVNYNNEINLYESEGIIQDPAKAIGINAVRVFGSDYYNGEYEIKDAASISVYAHQIKIKLTRLQSNLNYKLVLYNTECEYNREHYLFSYYTFNNTGVSVGYSLQLVRNH